MNEQSGRSYVAMRGLRTLTVIFTVFVTLWCVANRDSLIPKTGVVAALLSNVDIVKDGPFTDNPVMPIGKAFDSVTITNQWREFDSPKGVRVVEVEGVLDQNKLRENFLEDSFKPEEVCQRVPALKAFFEKHSDTTVEDFLGVVKDALENTNSVPASLVAMVAVYKKAKQEHFNAQVTIRQQFPVLIRASKTTPALLDDHHQAFRVGYACYQLSAGPYSGDEIKCSELADLVQNL